MELDQNDYESNSPKREMVSEANNAEELLFDAYFGRIKDVYLEISSRARLEVLSKLENLAATVERTSRFGLQNYSKLRKIRKDAGLTLQELAIELGLSKNTHPDLSRYERGKKDFVNSSGKVATKYREWLVEKGYKSL
ncbi:MAG: helix-turn-helix transcriptional regulator [archaeon]